MRRSMLLGVALLGVALVVGSGTSQDKGKTPTKGQLPAGWKKLGLSKEQTLKIYSVQSQYKTKIANLEEQIRDLREKQKTEMVQILTEEQKEKLRKSLLGEATKEKKTTPVKEK
jgi:Spy/CpxP family protein refolding chaperone